jgi:hypothetical protein
MRTMRRPGRFIAACAVVLATTAMACGGGERDAERDANGGSAASPAGTGGETDNGSSMSLTGCLQQGDSNNDFILTQVNEQPGPIATSGENDSTAVQQKQQERASKSYKLTGAPNELRDLVGHQVRVVGKTSGRAGGGSQEGNRPVDQDDLAELEVSSAESVANVCGRSGSGQDGQGERPRP